MLRVFILSTILFFLLVYLGIKYHWGDHLNNKEETSLTFQLPETNNISIQQEVIVDGDQNENFDNPQILENIDQAEILSLMSKEQIRDNCENLLNKTLKDETALLVATGNCVVSNYQKDANENQVNRDSDEKHKAVVAACKRKYQNIRDYSNIEKQLLTGICVSDTLSR